MYVKVTTYIGVPAEEPNPMHAVEELARLYLPGATIVESIGVWDGASERSIKVECIVDAEDEKVAFPFARAASERFAQDEVWITSEPIRLHKVER